MGGAGGAAAAGRAPAALHPAVRGRGAGGPAPAARPPRHGGRPPRAAGLRAVAEAVQPVRHRAAALLRERGAEAAQDPQGEP